MAAKLYRRFTFARCYGEDLLQVCLGHPCWLATTEWPTEAGSGHGQLNLLSDKHAHKLYTQLDHGSSSKRDNKCGIWQVQISEADALQFGLEGGDTALLSNVRGKCLASVHVQDGLMVGIAVLATGAWCAPTSDGVDRAGNPSFLPADISTFKLARDNTILPYRREEIQVHLSHPVLPGVLVRVRIHTRHQRHRENPNFSGLFPPITGRCV